MVPRPLQKLGGDSYCFHTWSSALLTSNSSLLNCFRHALSDSPSSCLIVSRWFVGLFSLCPPMKWHTNELLNYSKSSMDDGASLLNHTCAAPLKVVEKDRHRISLGVCCKPKVVLMVVMWLSGSFKLWYESSRGRQNFGGKGHSRILFVKGEYVIFTISSRFLVVFYFIAFFNSSMSFFILLRRSSFVLSNCSILLEPSLAWLFSKL